MYACKMSTQTNNDQLLIHYFQDSLSGAALRWYMGLDSANIRSFNDLGEAFVKQYKYNIVPPLEEKEMTKIFLKTLSSFYYERMIASAPSDFTEMVNMGMRLEEGVREGRLTREEGSSAKRYGAFFKKKDGEEHVVSSHTKQRRPSVKRKTMRPTSNRHQAYQPRNNNNTSTSYDRKSVTFDPIPMNYAELYPSLIERKLITPRDPPAILTNPQWWYKPELHCVYHSCAPGHDVENCYPLKTKVQDLVRSGILFFEDVGPNVKKNPLPEHGKVAVNMVQGCLGKYDSSKKKVSSTLVIKPAGPVPYSSDRVVPYRYNAVALEDRKEVPLPSTSVVSISDVSGVTSSGRVFSAPPKPHEDVLRRAAIDNSARPVGTSSSSPNSAFVVDKPVVVAKDQEERI
ncbi:hypothetical protein KIW84_071675 [Lathyrus oleraceus]|uniref:Retrotransposon gag domain-containing protein n=1 Tax=Pisum sativum TaxID=3888 RepID=A0A9D4ZWD8_PEA|nr:hypothetical protein KIW84_071675 [Pisum sativum]